VEGHFVATMQIEALLGSGITDQYAASIRFAEKPSPSFTVVFLIGVGFVGGAVMPKNLHGLAQRSAEGGGEAIGCAGLVAEHHHLKARRRQAIANGRVGDLIALSGFVGATPKLVGLLRQIPSVRVVHAQGHERLFKRF
jgi:hypothetical protein